MGKVGKRLGRDKSFDTYVLPVLSCDGLTSLLLNAAKKSSMGEAS